MTTLKSGMTVSSIQGIMNRITADLGDVADKIYSRDLFGQD